MAICISLWMAGTGFGGYSPNSVYAQTSDWQVKRDDREQLILQRLHKDLHAKPFSEYALRKIWAMHNTQAAREHLLDYYRRKMRTDPRTVTYRIILARLWERVRAWDKALAIYSDLSVDKAQQHLLQMAILRCLVELQQTKRALVIFEQVRGHLAVQRRQLTLLRLLRLVLADNDTASIQTALKHIAQEPQWKASQIADIARLLYRYRLWAESIQYYRNGLAQLRGQQRILVWIELLDAQISGQLYAQALDEIAKMRQVKTRNNWLIWELQTREIEIYRQQKRLGIIVEQLAKTWQNSRDYRQIFLLARLQDEIRKPEQATALYLRALEIQPSAREPRLRLLERYSKSGEIERVQLHLRELIAHKQAAPEHYLQFARQLIERSGHPPVPRWDPDWLQKYPICQGSLYKRRLVRPPPSQSLQAPSKSAIDHYRCNRLNWNYYRIRRWQYWRKYEANDAQRKMLREAIDILAQGNKNFPNHWEFLRDIEEIYALHGYTKRAQSVRKQMLAEVRAYTYRMENMQSLLIQEGEEKRIPSMLRNALREPNVPLKRAVEVAAMAFRPLRTAPRQAHTQTSAEKYKVWERAICPDIVRFLENKRKTLSNDDNSSEADLVIRLYAVMLRCGSQAPDLLAALSKLESQSLYPTQRLRQILQTYLRYNLSSQLQSLFSQLQKLYGEQWLEQTYAALNPSFSSDELQFLLQTFSAKAPSFPQIYRYIERIVRQICRSKDQCMNVMPSLAAIIQSTDTPIVNALNLLALAYDKGLLEAQWLVVIVQQRRERIADLHRLLEMPELFMQIDQTRLLHFENIVRTMELRRTPPDNIELWIRMFREHLRSSRINRDQLMPLLRRADLAAQRFPEIYHTLLEFYLTDYHYRRSYGPKRLIAWLNKEIHLRDLPLLERLFYILPQNQRSATFSKLLSRISRPDMLGWFYIFAAKYHKLMPDLHIAVMQRLSQIQPQNPSITQDLAMLLDKHPQYQNQADGLWMQLLKAHTQHYAPAAIRELSRRCCADHAAQRHARRLLTLALQQHGLSSIWDDLAAIFAKLDADQQHKLMYNLLSQPAQIARHRYRLANLATQHALHTVAISLLRTLSKQPKTPAKIFHQLAIALDQQGLFLEANHHWRTYLQKASITQITEFFNNMAKAHTMQGQFHHAQIAYYRAWLFSPKTQTLTMQKVLQLQQSGHHLQAWGAWLYLQGEQAAKCLVAPSNHQALNMNTPATLWQLDIIPHGPIAFFSPCQWTLPLLLQEQILSHILSYLQRDPQREIAFTGSADPQTEPDAPFLAQQRTLALRQLLLTNGIDPKRIHTKSSEPSALCTDDKPKASKRTTHKKSVSHPQLIHKQKSIRDSKSDIKPDGIKEKELSADAKMDQQISCDSYRRQLAIQVLGLDVMELQQFLSNDADRDGVPDYLDQCPLLPKNPQKYPFYYYRQNRQHQQGRTLHQWARNLRRDYARGRLQYHQEHRYALPETIGLSEDLSSSLTNQGCPPTITTLLLLHRHKDRLLLRREVVFRGHSTSIQSMHYPILDQIAALMNLAPHLGVLRIEIQPDLQTSPATAHPASDATNSNTAEFQHKLARKRAQSIAHYLHSRSLEPKRIQIEIHPHKQSDHKTKSGTAAYISFYFGHK
jgi:hypothetical protein